MPPIYLHNTLTGEKEIFSPIMKGEVSMYHCGPTVYNYLHIGNLRAYILADTLRRMFEANGYKVHQVVNITDVGHLTADNDEGLGDNGEDKIEKMAKSSGKTASEIAQYYTKIFFDDITALKVETSGTMFPKASEHITEQIALIQNLESKGFTYTTSDGVYFDTSKYAEYGKLGNINLDGLEAGARIGTNDEKRNITDFALWKFSKSGEKRFQEWESPWGVGFPGWHIECSAMSAKYLGDTFDIHTGGIDHIPVHHNNEIAQSECAHNGTPLAHYWLHNAFVNSDGKMSKSKGEFTRLVTLIEKGIKPVEYRYWLLQANYSSQMQYTEDAVRAGGNGYKNLITHIAKFIEHTDDKSTEISTKKLALYWDSFLEKINNNLDTPSCIALLWEIVKDSDLDDAQHIQKTELIQKIDSVLGLDLIEESKLYAEESAVLSGTAIPENIASILIERKSAREQKNWALSDELRDKVKALGFEILDTGSEQTIKKI